MCNCCFICNNTNKKVSQMKEIKPGLVIRITCFINRPQEEETQFDLIQVLMLLFTQTLFSPLKLQSKAMTDSSPVLHVLHLIIIYNRRLHLI